MLSIIERQLNNAIDSSDWDAVTLFSDKLNILLIDATVRDNNVALAEITEVMHQAADRIELRNKLPSLSDSVSSAYNLRSAINLGKILLKRYSND